MGNSFRDLALYMGKRAPIVVARKGLIVLFGVLTFAVLARTLSKEQFAIYNLIFVYIAILRLTTLPGLGTAVTQAFARSKPGGYKRATKLSLLGSLLGSIGIFGAAGWHFFGEERLVGQLFLVTAFVFPLYSGLLFWKNATVGAEKYSRLLLYDGSASFLKCIAVISCTYFFPEQVFPVVVAALISPAVINVFATIHQTCQLQTDAPSESGFVEYGIRTTLYQIPTVLSQQLDKMILFYFISPNALATYAVALRIPELVRTVTGEVNTTLGPVFARSDKYTKALHYFSLKLWLFYLLVSIIGALFIVPYILPILVGDNYSESLLFAQIMMIGAALGYLGDIQFRYIKSHLHSQNFLKITIMKSFFDCLLIITLVYQFELIGAVYAYALKNLVYTMITNWIIRTQYLKF